MLLTDITAVNYSLYVKNRSLMNLANTNSFFYILSNQFSAQLKFMQLFLIKPFIFIYLL